jgi:hypothetical protein
VTRQPGLPFLHPGPGSSQQRVISLLCTCGHSSA